MLSLKVSYNIWLIYHSWYIFLSNHLLLQKVSIACVFVLKLIFYLIYLFPTVLELVGPVPRIFAANWSLIVWCFGLFLFTLLVYCERNWFYLMLWLAIPTIPPLVFWMWELLTSSFFCIVIHKQMHRQLGVFFYNDVRLHMTAKMSLCIILLSFEFMI